MQTRELIILLLLILLAAVVIAFVVRRGNAKRAEDHRAQAQQTGSQASWLESADGPAEAVAAAGAGAVAPAVVAPAGVAAEPVVPAEPVVAAEPAAATVPAVPAEPAVVSEDAPTPVEAVEEQVEVPMTRAERREAREAAEDARAVAEEAHPAGPAWAGAVGPTDPAAERIAAAAGFRDEVSDGDALSEDIAIPANEWGGPREEVLDEEPMVENPVEDDLHVAEPEEPTVENPVEDDLPQDEPGVPAEDDLPEGEPAALVEDVVVTQEPTPEDMREQGGRRISGFLELRDGGFGVGSAAPLEDGAQPLDHPVQAYRDTMTFRAPGDPGYDSAEPDVWFYDAGAAERSGFRPADA